MDIWGRPVVLCQQRVHDIVGLLLPRSEEEAIGNVLSVISLFFLCQDLLHNSVCTLVVPVFIGANEEFEKQIAAANQKCSVFFDMMKKDKEQALLLPPYEFEVCWAPFVSSTLMWSCVAVNHVPTPTTDFSC